MLNHPFISRMHAAAMQGPLKAWNISNTKVRKAYSFSFRAERLSGHQKTLDA